MTKWEYKTVSVQPVQKGSDNFLWPMSEGNLNDLGNQGWELIGPPVPETYLPSSGDVVPMGLQYVFKRVKK